MPRKNYTSKSARRVVRADLPVILPGFFDDVEGVYEITVSNGSGFQRLTMNGTQEIIWAWAAQAGRQGGLGAGRWEPVSIKLIRPLAERQAFVALV